MIITIDIDVDLDLQPQQTGGRNQPAIQESIKVTGIDGFDACEFPTGFINRIHDQIKDQLTDYEPDN